MARLDGCAIPAHGYELGDLMLALSICGRLVYWYGHVIRSDLHWIAMTRKRKQPKAKKIKARLSTSPADKLGADVKAKYRTWFDDVLDVEDGLTGCILLEPREQLDTAIVGWDMDANHVIYSYEKLVAAFYEAFDDEDEDDRLQTAVEWVDYNVVRGVAYMGERRPVIIRTGDQE
jgi:hypothetical protein